MEKLTFFCCFCSLRKENDVIKLTKCPFGTSKSAASLYQVLHGLWYMLRMQKNPCPLESMRAHLHRSKAPDVSQTRKASPDTSEPEMIFVIPLGDGWLAGSGIDLKERPWWQVPLLFFKGSNPEITEVPLERVQKEDRDISWKINH